MKKIWEKYGDMVPYLLFGIFTTIVNYAVYWLATRKWQMGTTAATVLAWILAVFFAYITNRKWVFHSTASGAHEILREIAAFFAARVATGVFDIVFMFLTVDQLGWPDMAMKLLSNVFVVALNYVFSKFLIFRHKKTKDD